MAVAGEKSKRECFTEYEEAFGTTSHVRVRFNVSSFMFCGESRFRVLKFIISSFPSSQEEMRREMHRKSTPVDKRKIRFII